MYEVTYVAANLGLPKRLQSTCVSYTERRKEEQKRYTEICWMEKEDVIRLGPLNNLEPSLMGSLVGTGIVLHLWYGRIV